MIVVAGGSGLLGRHLVAGILSRGQQVAVLVRDMTRAESLFGGAVDVRGGDVRHRDGLDARVAGAGVVVSAVHGLLGGRGAGPAAVDERGNANLIDAAAKAGAHVVLVSVCGASADHPLDLFRAKYAAEQHLRASRAPWTIVRAPAYLETWLAVLDSTAGSTGRPLVFGRGVQPIPFASVIDVAAVVARAAVDPSLRGRVLDIAGDAITMNSLADALKSARGWQGASRHLPRGMLRALSTLARPVSPAFARKNRMALAMDVGTVSTPVTDAFPLESPQTLPEVLAGFGSAVAVHK